MYEAFQTNNLTAYDSRDAAEEGEEQLSQKEYFSSVQIAKLKMKIAETEQELNELKHETSFVIIQGYRHLKEYRLLGQYTEKSVRVCDTCSYLYASDFNTFDSVERASDSAREVSRQSGTSAAVSAFILEYI